MGCFHVEYNPSNILINANKQMQTLFNNNSKTLTDEDLENYAKYVIIIVVIILI